MKKFLLTFSILFSFSVHSQDSVYVHFSMRDRFSKETIKSVQIYNQTDKYTVIGKSKPNGEAVVKLEKKEFIEFRFEHPLYLSATKDVSLKKVSNMDTLQVKITMNRMDVKHLNEVVIKPNGVPTKVFGVTNLSVADFEIVDDANFILLTYPKRLNKGSELIVFDGEKVKSHFKVDGIAKELVRDFRGNTNIICEENVYGVYLSNERIGLANIDKTYFSKYIAPVIDTNSTKLYFSTFDKNYPEMDYMIYDNLDSSYTKVMTVQDELMMELYRSEYKWVDVRVKLWAKNMEHQTGIDAQTWVGANYFTKSLYYKELYAPLFHRNDTIFVFDYYQDLLFTYSESGSKIDSIPLYHHYHPKQTGWKKNLIQDKVTGQIYSQHEIDGIFYIRLVDTKTGELGDKIKLYHKYVEKVEVYNNSVYYIYRPFESIQKKYLYQEKLPYSFEKEYIFTADPILKEE